MNYPVPTPPQGKRSARNKARPSSQRGFALVIALSLMAFILVLLLTLSSLVRVESSSAQNQLAQLQARQNARLGAMIALGELQKSMGPDTRVSARADILSTTNPDDPDSGVSPFDADEQTRFWTGVWNSANWNPGLATDRQDRFESWLVSLPTDPATGASLNRQIDAVKAVEGGALLIDLNDSEKAVTLAKIRAKSPTSGNVDPTPIRAGLLPITAAAGTGGNETRSGSFAWWASDEGVKAHPGLVDPNAGTRQATVTADIPRFLFQHRGNFSSTEWFKNTDFNASNLIDRLRKARNLPSPGDLIFDNSIATLSVDAENALAKDSLLADYSFYPFGVLSSTRRGGLRGDLSLAFWREPAEMGVFDPDEPFTNVAFENDFRRRRIFNYQDYPQTEQTIRSPAATDKRFYAPRWEILRDFHNSFQRMVDPDGATARIAPIRSATGGILLPISRLSTNGNMNITLGYSHQDQHDRYAPDDPSLELTVNPDGTGALRDPITNPFTPLMLRYSMQFEISSKLKVDSSGNPVLEDPSDPSSQLYQLVMRVRPTLVLWNPHNVAISHEIQDALGTYANMAYFLWRVDGSRFDMRFTLTKSGGTSKTYDLLKKPGALGLTESKGDLRMSLNRSNPELNEFAPGEIKVLTVNSITSGNNWGWAVPNAVELSSIFPPSDTFIELDENLNEDNDLEFLSGDTVEIVTHIIPRGDGPRPQFQNAENATFKIQEFRVLPPSEFGPETTSLTVDGLNSAILGTLDLHFLPGPSQSKPDYWPRRFANFNIRAIGPKGGFANAYGGQMPNVHLGFIGGTTDVEKDGVASGLGTLMRGFWGSAVDGGSGKSFISLFDVPRRPPESLGQYQHAHLAVYHPNLPTYPFGNSLADPHVDRAYAVDFNNARTLIDLSWLLNDAIWDDYFLSTIDPYDIDNLSPPRLEPLRDRFVELDNTVVYDHTGANPADLDYSEVAENLLLRGAFNVNSTSVEAWASLLAGLSGEGINFLDPENLTLNTTNNLTFPFFRHSVPLGPENSPWLGGPRDLKRDQIRTLAKHIVDEVKRRGPFLSLSDFINRRLTSDDRGLSGVIQSAIDAERTDIQTVISDSDKVELADAPYLENADADGLGNPLDMAPGYLSQADVLTTIAPSISARSDTFVIRSYGRSDNPSTDQVDSEAWYEMLVQRFPEPSGSPDFGRRFRVLHVRFLDESQI